MQKLKAIENRTLVDNVEHAKPPPQLSTDADDFFCYAALTDK